MPVSESLQLGYYKGLFFGYQAVGFIGGVFYSVLPVIFILVVGFFIYKRRKG